MAKTIKFNLICDGNSVRTLEDLRENFSMEDILAYYDNKLLHRWLGVRGYQRELAFVEELQAESVSQLLQKLIEIFQIETDEISIAEHTYALEYQAEREKQLRQYESMENAAAEITQEYHLGYDKLIAEILKEPSNMAKIKANIQKIDTYYFPLFKLQYRTLFYRFMDKAPKAIFAILMRENMRKVYLPVVRVNQQGMDDYDWGADVSGQEEQDNEAMLRMLRNSMSVSKLTTMLKDDMRVCQKNTEDVWDHVESDDTKEYMILRMEPGSFVRHLGDKDCELSSDDVINNFVILKGIDYKSGRKDHKLLYLEV